ncbi:uncharacterized protein BO97DRAFT_125583 [Aspergillus homomorphus CBS 101889]|uniref:Uncharacterized protein n=1 Tax=Aspergillus homomorphus (strain CBS 101889) TaxID=1450537 RepID=A0A395HR37_ASPHC|nr:hypothetical protein BO97DRAFT_125583 [Aspergillus homomorphus CBS 101889]RAL10421.1 hypothetical protein BO97DRAFT_125583 [Aspergillus homomorphus CBS 101889]
MWLYRGAQSAVFYYATCTPCAESSYRRNRMKEAARSKREQEKSDAIVTDQPKPFAQPTPFSTNPAWAEEIALGPGPPARRGGHRTHRRMESWNTDGASVNSQHGSANTTSRKDKLKNPLGERWSRMRYQREDEPLWGQEMEVKGSSVGLSGGGRADEVSNSKYYIARVPPVNDLHPPIVSGPKSRAETRWMLQPPPSARVMAGKERIADSTSKNTKSSDISANAKPSVEAVQAQPPVKTQSIERSASRAKAPAMAPDGWYDPRADGLEEDGDDESPRYGRDESHLVIAPSLHSRFESCSSLSSDADSEAESPRVSLHSPQTPTSRPGSKATQDSGKHFPTISKTMSTFQHQHQPGNNNKVEMLHLEINDSPDDIALGQLERLRPWRWSMDI